MNMDIGTNHAEDCFPPSEADFHILALHLNTSRTFIASVHQDLKGLQALALSSRFVKVKNPEWVCFVCGA
jgi:hypothetical protein